MNVLDENVPEHQRLLLHARRIFVRQIGYEVGRKTMQDDEIIPLLHTLARPTFLTRDRGFYQRRLCHPDYCLGVFDVGERQMAHFARRFLRHPALSTWARRRGAVILVGESGLRAFRWRRHDEEAFAWPT